MSLIFAELLPTPTAKKLPAVSSSASLAANTAFCEATLCLNDEKSDALTPPAPAPAIGAFAAADVVADLPFAYTATAVTAPIAATSAPAAIKLERFLSSSIVVDERPPMNKHEDKKFSFCTRSRR
jgi:hypothetical protein